MSEQIRELLGGISAGDFLQHYWQKQPYLIRKAVPELQSFITKQQLMDLACHDGVESRLVIEKDGAYPWQVINGPMTRSDFHRLPATHWTLLVQSLELHSEDAACLMEKFNFIPRWRIDDLMISYAVENGSVGPHVDSYDVFLLQSSGRRTWRINQGSYSENDFIPGLDLRIIDNFIAEDQWILEPGDMLYLPPGVAHHGTALEDGMTISIGCRAPSGQELLHNYVDDIITLHDDNRYTDPDLTPPVHCGEISQENLTRIRDMLRAPVMDDELIDHWFGCYVTRLPENIEPDVPPALTDMEQFTTLFNHHGRLYRNLCSRFVFIQGGQNISLFVNGRIYTLASSTKDVIVKLAEQNCIEAGEIETHPDVTCLMELSCRLYNDGFLLPDCKHT